MPYGGSDI
jgi:hypothetical protein